MCFLLFLQYYLDCIYISTLEATAHLPTISFYCWNGILDIWYNSMILKKNNITFCDDRINKILIKILKHIFKKWMPINKSNLKIKINELSTSLSEVKMLKHNANICFFKHTQITNMWRMQVYLFVTQAYQIRHLTQ